MIEINHISVQLGDRPILDNLSISIEAGQKVSLFGESGSGKTTLLKAIIGWHPIAKGDIHIKGHALSPSNLATIRSHIFYLPQDIRASGDETVREYLSYPFDLKVNQHLVFNKDNAFTLFTKMKLRRDLMDRPLQELSGGERKRVGLARGFLLSRPIFLLDEPTSAVDGANKTLLVDMILENPKWTVISITHDTEFCNRASSRCLSLKNGQLVEGAL